MLPGSSLSRGFTPRMIRTLLFAQLNNPHQGWLTSKLLSVTLSSAEWVLWLLGLLSVVSVAIMLERLLYFVSHRLPNSHEVAAMLAKGDFERARTAIGDRKGMEAALVRDALASVSQGPDSVQEVIAATVARERPQY